MENILISACLLGVCCRYDGESKPIMQTVALMERYHLVPVCPEQLGGLPTPREPSERQGCAVVMKSGTDVTAQYRRGAEQTLHLARLYGCKAARSEGAQPELRQRAHLRRHVLRPPDIRRRRNGGAFEENGIAVYGEERDRSAPVPAGAGRAPAEPVLTHCFYSEQPAERCVRRLNFLCMH